MGGSKLRFCKLINNEINILILDAPTNHLDVEANDELKISIMGKGFKYNIFLN